MLTKRQLSVVGVLGATVVVALLLSNLVYYDRIDPEEFRAELIERGIIGSTPLEANAILSTISIPEGSEVVVGRFNPATGRAFASVSNAQRLAWNVWRVRVELIYNTSQRVDSVEVTLTADRPL